MHKLIELLLLILSLTWNFYIISAYTQVALSGSGSDSSDGPRIFKALNTDLIFPKIFNSSEHVVSTTEQFTVSSSSSSSTTAAPPTTTPPIQLAYNHQYDNVPIYVTPAAVRVDASENNGVPPTQSQQTPEIAAMPEEPLQEQDVSTGRAVDSRKSYPFSQFIGPYIRKPTAAVPTVTYRQRPKPLPYARTSSSTVIYPQSSSAYYRQPNRAEFDQLHGQAKFTDRFSPSEGVAASQFSKHHNHDHSHAHANNAKVPASSNVVSSYVPPKNLYAFPPLNANYPSPADDPKAALPSDTVTSYLPPASGASDAGYKYVPPSTAASNGGYQYPGPIMPMSNSAKATDAMKAMPAAGGDDGAGDADDSGNDDTIGVLPASAMDAGGDAGNDQAGKDAGDSGVGGTAASDGDAGTSDDLPELHKDHNHDDAQYDFNKEYATPPPGWLEAHPEATVKPADHDHHIELDQISHDHDHPHIEDPHHELEYIPPHHDFPSYPAYHVSYPEIGYDDHDHYHHHHHIEPLPPPPPPPTKPAEPAPEPRVKKYSYFYIGRKLWYIPLYFTVWFSFYVLWLIIKSIARHKVNLPNHYVSRRSLPDYSTAQRDEYINNLTVTVLEHIDNFKRKYIT